MKSEGQKQSLKHEKRLEKIAGGKRSAASGAFWSRKGDVRSDDLLIEHKWTGQNSDGGLRTRSERDNRGNGRQKDGQVFSGWNMSSSMRTGDCDW